MERRQGHALAAVPAATAIVGLSLARSDAAIAAMMLLPHTLCSTGAVSAFAFEPTGLWPLMPSRSPFCANSSAARRARTGAAVGWAFGVGQFVVGLNWIALPSPSRRRCRRGSAGSRWCCCRSISPSIRRWRPASPGGSAGSDRVALVIVLAGAWAITEWLRGDDVHRLRRGTRAAAVLGADAAAPSRR